MDLTVRFDLDEGLIHTLVSVSTGELLSAAEMLIIQKKLGPKRDHFLDEVSRR